MGVMHSLALEIVRCDQVEPEVDHLRRLREHGEPATEAVDSSARLYRGPTQPVGGHGAGCDTPEFEKHLSGDREPVACSKHPCHRTFCSPMLGGCTVGEVQQDVRVEQTVGHQSYMESRWVAARGSAGLWGRFAIHSSSHRTRCTGVVAF